MTVCTFTMEYIKANYFIPGQIENWIILIDFGNLGISQLPFKVIIVFMNTSVGSESAHHHIVKLVSMHC
ncbi:MAG: hypothetical protein ACMG6E_04970, partial [Candidatus Roizmanbacteria bacterium]